VASKLPSAASCCDKLLLLRHFFSSVAGAGAVVAAVVVEFCFPVPRDRLVYRLINILPPNPT